MMDEEVHFGFAEQVEAARNGWLQGRYYSEDGETVADFLSFRSVFEINPFVVGVSYARERRVYAAWRKVVDRLLDVRELMGRAFTSLSNGEMRPVDRLFLRRRTRSRGAILRRSPAREQVGCALKRHTAFRRLRSSSLHAKCQMIYCLAQAEKANLKGKKEGGS